MESIMKCKRCLQSNFKVSVTEKLLQVEPYTKTRVVSILFRAIASAACALIAPHFKEFIFE
jgi:hypothetical protein